MNTAGITRTQRVIDKACNMVVGNNKYLCRRRVSEELGVILVDVKGANARTRAITKWRNTKTWMSDLFLNPMTYRRSTWVSGTNRWLKNIALISIV